MANLQTMNIHKLENRKFANICKNSGKTWTKLNARPTPLHMTHSHVVRIFDRSTPPHIVTLVALSGLSALAMNLFIPSLPMMAEHFQTSYGLMQMAIPAYLAVNAATQIFIGPISDLLGRRPVMLWGIALFCLATIGCLIAPDVYTFLVFRMLQAVIATGMVLSRAVVRDLYPQDQAASRIGYVTMGMAIVPMLGPVLGGYMGEWFGWKSNFWILLGTGALMFWVTWTDAGETRAQTGRSLRQQMREYPELLMSPRFWGYALSSAFASGAFFSYLGGAPFVATEIYGLNAAELGRFFGAPALGYFAGNYVSGRYSARFGVNRMILWGCWAVTIGMALLMAAYLLGHGGVYVFFGLMTFVGVGNGLTIPNATAGMLSVRPSLAGSASGLGGTLMLAGGAALSALAGAILTPGTGPWPLLWLMLTTSICSLVAIYFVIWRAKQIEGVDVR